MSAPGTDPACVELAEYFLEAELQRAGRIIDTDPDVLSLAVAIQEAVEAWYRTRDQAGEGAP